MTQWVRLYYNHHFRLLSCWHTAKS